MNKNIKNALLTLAALTAVSAPLAGYAFAQSSAQSQSAQADAETNDGPDSSLSLPAETAGTEVPDIQEQSQEQALARISAAQASAAAQNVVSGAVSSVTLNDENGTLVYEVIIGKVAVLVDAGNGQVLGQSAAETEGPGNGMKNGTETND